MRCRLVLCIGCVVVGLGAVAGLDAHSHAAPACGSDVAQRGVYDALHGQFHLDSLFLHNFTPLSGGFFSDARDCSAEVVEIRGNISASDMPWRQVRYRIVQAGDPGRPVVTVSLGDAAPFAEHPTQTLWSRLLERF